MPRELVDDFDLNTAKSSEKYILSILALRLRRTASTIYEISVVHLAECKMRRESRLSSPVNKAEKRPGIYLYHGLE